MTSSTKPEVHNVLYYGQTRTEPQPQVTHFIAFEHVVFEICLWTEGRTDRLMYADRNISHPPGGEITRKTALHRDRTDRISLTHYLQLDLWPWPSVPRQLWSWPTHTQKFKVNAQSDAKIEWKQTDGQTDVRDRRTDRRTEAIALLPSLMQPVIISEHVRNQIWTEWCFWWIVCC